MYQAADKTAQHGRAFARKVELVRGKHYAYAKARKYDRLGGLAMLIPAIIKVKLNASEMVCSLMLNYVIMYIILHFLNNTFADRSKGSTQTYPFLE